MKRILLPILVIGILLLSACDAPTTAPPTEAPPTLPAAEEPVPPVEAPPIPPPTEPNVISITAIELYSAYEDNEVAADAQYKGKILDVTGIVESIGKDILDTPYVVLTDGSEWAVWGVQCMFSSTDEPQLAKLSKGQEVTIRGKCDGYLINVILRKCSLGAPTTAPPVEAPSTPPPTEQPEPTPTPSPEEVTPPPPPPTFEPIVITGSGDKTSPPFTVTTEEWIIDWSYVPDPEYPEFAVFGFFIYPRGETALYIESVLFPEGTSGSTYSYAGAGEYYIKVTAGNVKSWEVVISPP